VIEAPIDLHAASSFQSGIPHEAFATMRETPGLTWSPASNGTRGFWSVTRYDDLVTVSRDPETYSSGVGHIQIYDIDEDALEARASMIDMDPPIHTRLRRIISSAFTPRHVQGYRQAIQNRVATCLDQLEREGGGNWVDIVAKPIPIGVICDLMGVPEPDHDFLIELTDYLVAGTGTEPLEPNAYGNTTDLRLLPFNSPAAWAMSQYATTLADQRRRVPADDLITKLIEAEIDGDRLTTDEFANFFRLMIFAGNETTRSSMAHLALYLHQFPEAFNALRQDPSKLAAVTEEVIRYSSAILYFRRTVTTPTVLSGTELHVGDKVVMWYSAANFDETQFPHPHEFRTDRPITSPHAAFGGGGAHFCLGASLARLEIAELISAIIDRDISFASTGEPTFVESNFVNGIEILEVTL